MTLTGPQLRTLTEAMLDAFDHDSLERMVS